MEIKKIAVLGSGTMGHGIAQVAAMAGFEVNLRDTNEVILDKAMEKIKACLSKFAQKGQITEEDAENDTERIKTFVHLKEAVEDVDYVIEAVPEILKLKQQIFKEINGYAPEHTIFATNTSALRITEIAEATKQPEKVVGMHWWNPPQLMPLVEIIKGDKTSDETVDITWHFTQCLGKVPVVCKDSPGFIGVRLQAALVIEAISILEQGLATAEDIDTTVKMSLGLRLPVIGPLEIVDMGGMDVFLNAYDYLHSKLGDKFRPPDLLRQNVEEGRLGLKTGKGFYEYTAESAEALTKRRDDWMLSQLKERTKELRGDV
nr:3-hydroxyacyl-CoA dehydrogenase family protein [Candidatus Freyarchaeota archaeon]